MCSETYPKDFERATEVLPFTKYGISTYEEFKKVEERIHHLEQLKKAGLTSEEIKLYEENEAGRLEQHCKIESSVLKGKLVDIYSKINSSKEIAQSSEKGEEQASTSNPENIFERLQKTPLKFYPQGHPMNELKELEESLFGHLKHDVKHDDIIPITKRRKILRRLERRKERILAQGNQLISTVPIPPSEPRPGSLWDVKDLSLLVPHRAQKQIIGPQKQTMYTIRDSKIVRLEPVENEEKQEVFRAVDILVPVNQAEQQLLEGTKMSIDYIRKMDRFKDYEPGVPSKVLYLKNIAPSVTQEQLSLLFNQFVLDNGGPVDIRLMTGRMRGQAFVDFRNEEVAIQALDEVNGTILCGRPIIAQFGRNSNRIQCDNR